MQQSMSKELTDIIDQIKPELKRRNLWSKASNKLTSKINEIIPNQKEKGIDIVTGERNREGNRVIRLERVWRRVSNHKEEEREINLKSIEKDIRITLSMTIAH
jgi:hypothetical protein